METPAHAPRRSSPDGQRPAAPIRVVVADPNPLLRHGLRCVLAEAQGVEVVAVACGLPGLARAVEATDPDVLLQCTSLREALALDPVRRRLDASPPMRVLCLCHPDDEAALPSILRQGRLPGSAGYATRDDRPEHLVEGLRALQQGAPTYLSPRAAARVLPSGRSGAALLRPLSEREEEMLRQAALGAPNAEIARALHLTPGTLRNCLSVLYEKLGVSTRAEAVAWAWRSGLVRDGPPRDDGRHLMS